MATCDKCEYDGYNLSKVLNTLRTEREEWKAKRTELVARIAELETLTDALSARIKGLEEAIQTAGKEIKGSTTRLETVGSW